MKGFIGLTAKEKEDILKLHSKPYDGYSVGNVNTRVLTYTFFLFALSLSCLRWYSASPKKYSGIPATTSNKKPLNMYTSSIFIQNK